MRKPNKRLAQHQLKMSKKRKKNDLKRKKHKLDLKRVNADKVVKFKKKLEEEFLEMMAKQFDERMRKNA